MEISLTTRIFMIFTAIVFTIALTFASIELPGRLSAYLDREVQYPDIDSHADKLSIYRTELYIQHYHIRLIGYISLFLVIILIAAGFITGKSGLASLGVFVFFLPLFGQFASVMFFLAGLGMLNLIWMPILDFAPWVLNLGDIIYVPYRIIAYIPSRFGIDIRLWFSVGFMGIGLLIFTMGTTAWFYNKFRENGTADFWIYRYSRHPQYLGWIIWSYGLLIYFVNMPYPKRSWGIPYSLPLLISSMFIIGVAMLEELSMKRKWGEEYELYRRKTPFMFPLPSFISRIISAPMRLILRKENPIRKRKTAAVTLFYTALIMVISVLYINIKSPSGIIYNKENRIKKLINTIRESDNRRTRNSAATSIIKFGKASVLPLIELSKENDSQTRYYAIRSLGKIGSEDTVETLIKALSDNNTDVCCAAIQALGDIHSEKAIQPLIGLMDNENDDISHEAVYSLAKIGSKQVVGRIADDMKSDKWYIRCDAAKTMGYIKSEKSIQYLEKALLDKDKRVRRLAALSLLRIESYKSLKDALKDEDWEVRFYAREASKRMKN
ncbi:DUF1295 domain-containing protein [Candidatus Poribacteria bacterium]|nr:DUF1295 domain-containing protein [Candidatus Poribacteria bacterium]